MSGFDFVELSASERVVDGLSLMLTAAIGEHAYIMSRFVDVTTALLIIEIAKRAPDDPDWFPRGKWATIQALQNAAERQIRKVDVRFAEAKP